MDRKTTFSPLEPANATNAVADLGDTAAGQGDGVGIASGVDDQRAAAVDDSAAGDTARLDHLGAAEHCGTRCGPEYILHSAGNLRGKISTGDILRATEDDRAARHAAGIDSFNAR